MERRQPKLMVISQAFAPYVSGSSVLLANLLKEYPGERMAIAGYSRYTKKDPNFLPPCDVVYLKPLKGKFFELAYARFLNSQRWYVRSFFLKQIKKFKPDAILAAFPHSIFFIAAYEVAEKCGIPFYAHMHDLWQENYPKGYYARKLADKYEGKILRSATHVFCMTSTQAEYYSNKYGVRTEVLPHTVTQKDLINLKYNFVNNNNKKLLFAGAISEVMNSDALAVLSRSKNYLKNKVEFNFFTPADEAEVIAKGIDPSNINLKWISREELKVELNTSDILFAPLSHKNCSDLEVKTVFSTKLLEYLVAGRPILVFAPKDSFHAISARKNNWALVVDKDDETELAHAIDQLLTNESLAKQIVVGAFKEANERSAVYFAHKLSERIAADIDNKSIPNSKGKIEHI